MSDGAKGDKPSRPNQQRNMAVDEDKKGNSGEEPNAHQMRRETMDEAPLFSEFSGSGRTGRRNALPNIMQESVAAIGTSAITEMLDQLTCAGGSGGSGAAGGTGAGNARPEEEMGACGGSEATPNQRLNPS